MFWRLLRVRERVPNRVLGLLHRLLRVLRLRQRLSQYLHGKLCL